MAIEIVCVFYIPLTHFIQNFAHSNLSFAHTNLPFNYGFVKVIIIITIIILYPEVHSMCLRGGKQV